MTMKMILVVYVYTWAYVSNIRFNTLSANIIIT